MYTVLIMLTLEGENLLLTCFGVLCGLCSTKEIVDSFARLILVPYHTHCSRFRAGAGFHLLQARRQLPPTRYGMVPVPYHRLQTAKPDLSLPRILIVVVTCHNVQSDTCRVHSWLFSFGAG